MSNIIRSTDYSKFKIETLGSCLLPAACSGADIDVSNILGAACGTIDATTIKIAARLAAKHGYRNCCLKLINAGAKPGPVIFWLARNGHLDALDWVLCAYSDKVPIKLLNKALLATVRNNKIYCAKRLIKSGADNFNECLLAAAKKERIDLADLFIDSGATNLAETSVRWLLQNRDWL